MAATEKQRETMRSFYANNKERFAYYGAHYRDMIKAEMVEAYGGKCLHCGIDDPVILSLDHINDDSHVEKELFNNTSRGGAKRYGLLKKQGWPKDRFQLLCFNCNAKKEHARRRNVAQEKWGEPEIYSSDYKMKAQAKVGTRAHNTSGFKGVFWNNQRQKWQAHIMFNYKTKHLGFYDNIVDAAKAHRQGTIEIWGNEVPVLTDEEIEVIAAKHFKPATTAASLESLGL